MTRTITIREHNGGCERQYDLDPKTGVARREATSGEKCDTSVVDLNTPSVSPTNRARGGRTFWIFLAGVLFTVGPVILWVTCIAKQLQAMLPATGGLV
jgi:hypothetical protein